MLKSKKTQLIIMSLILALTTSSCGKNKSADYLKEAEEIMAMYEDEIDIRDKERIDNFFDEYINKYSVYMNEEQYTTFSYLMMNIYQTGDSYPYTKTRDFLNIMMDIDENEFGRGLYRAFNMRTVYEGIFSAWKFNDNCYNEFNTLRSITGDDKKFFSAIFKKDISTLIKVITENTGAPTSTVETLILKLDAYSDIISQRDYDDYNGYKEYNLEELKKSYEKSIKQYMAELVQCKMEKDEDFSSTLYGKLLRVSSYYEDSLVNDKEHYEVTNNLIRGTASIRGEYSGYVYSFSISSDELTKDISIEDIKKAKVEEIISKGNDENNYLEYQTMSLMIHLIDPETLEEPHLSASQTRELFYENLKDEFSDIKEFDNFFLTVYNGSNAVFYKYFEVLTKIIERDGITDDDYIRFTSLVNFIKDKTSVYIDWCLDVEYPPYFEILKMEKEEYQEVVSSSVTNLMFDDFDYETPMRKINDILKNNNLGYKYFFSPNCCYNYNYGKIIVNPSHAFVISDVVKPQNGRISGVDVIYYEIPNNYESGNAVKCFYNIERELTTVPINGFVEDFYDEISGRYIHAFITDINTNMSDDLGDVRFMEYYEYYNENKNGVANKSLTLEEK